MKITIDVQGAPVEITLTPEQLAQIKAQKKPKLFEWDYPTFHFIDVNAVFDGTKVSDYIDHGRYRKTKEAAEQSLLRNKRANRLEALAEQLGGLKEFCNSDIDKDPSFEVFYDSHNKYWSCMASSYYRAECVYMTKECAIEICRMLNEGEFSLDDELK